MSVEAMFEPDGDRLVPTLGAQGPWDPTTAHGGPVAGLLAREVERADTGDEPMRVGRLTLDLFRPVPLQPLHLRHEIVRAGRQIRVVDAELWWDEKMVARASAVFVRVGHEIESDVEAAERAAAPTIPGPDSPLDPDTQLLPEIQFDPPGLFQTLELRRVAGRQGDGVPAVAWTRLTKPLVAGEETSPLQRFATIGDFASGLGNYVDYRTYVCPNADLSYHLLRYPEGEWVGLDANTVVGPDGIAQSRARAFDQTGFLGNIATTLVVSPRT